MRRREFLASAAAPALLRARVKAEPFPLSAVRLLDPACRALAERNRAFIQNLEPDRLLHMFRLTAGLPSAAEPLGGWERPDCEVRGHFTGHYLSALALNRMDDRAQSMVAELARCQRANGGGYLSAFSPDLLERLKQGQKVWAPWYTLHKVMAGLLDVHQLCGNSQALEVLEGMAAWTARWAGSIPELHMARILDVEFGGMSDVLYQLSGVTGQERYATLAHRFDHARILDPLAQGRDELRGLHANTTIPKIIGAARRYELTGESRSRGIAEFFWRSITSRRSYVTGGTSNREHWHAEPGVLASELSDRTQECCCTYNMLKLTRHLFSWNPSAEYADYFERALLNGILGTMNPDDGMTMYYVPLASGYWKLFGTPRNSFWCCTGTGIESFSKLADSIYFHDATGLWVNLLLSSELDWRGKGLRLTQRCEQDRTTLVFETERPVQLELRLRVPHWARSPRVKLNEDPVPGARPGHYFKLARLWKTGDRVELGAPMSLRAEAMPDDPTMQAFLYGPYVLAGILGSERLAPELQYGDAKGGRFLRGKPTAAPELHTTTDEPAAWILPVSGRTPTFRTTGQAQDVTLVPLNQLFGHRYAVYWRVRKA